MSERKKKYDQEWRAANREWQQKYDRSLSPEQKVAHCEAKKARKKKFRADFVGPRKPLMNLKGPDSPLWKSEEEKKATKNAARRRYYENNKAKARAKDALREASKAQRTPGWFGELDRLVVEEAYALLALRKTATGIDWHVDHVVPLRGETVSGFHAGNNLAVIPAAVNLLKGNRTWPDMP